MTRLLQSLVLACAAALSSVGALAQPYPAKAVRVVVPQSPGGATDVFARFVSQKLSAKWGQPVVVENRPGAAGVLGTDVVAKSAPDGYTLLVTYAGSQAVNPSLYRNIPFDSVKDFQPVTTIAVTPFLFVVGPKSAARDLREFIAAAKAKPGSLTYASSGNGSINHLLGEMLKTEAGIDLLHVPYKGIAAAIGDVIGGQVDSAFTSVPSVIGQLRAGKLRALAVSSARRNRAVPDVPAIAEAGLPGFDVNPWWGILAPAGTPSAVVDRINADTVEVLHNDEARAFFAKQGSEIRTSTPEEFLATLQSDVEKWARVVKASGARID